MVSMRNGATVDSAGRAVRWHRALDPDALPEDRVTAVTLGETTVCLTHF
jgi:hypothetical protein